MGSRLALAAIVVALLSATVSVAQPATTPGDRAKPSGTTVLKFFDTSGEGKLLSPGQARGVMDGANGWDSDALLDPDNMQDVRSYPLYAANSTLRFDIPGRRVAFAVAWPTSSRGYSYVILDNGGEGFDSGGVVVFNYRAALDAKRRLDEALAKRPDYAHSPAFDAAYDEAESELRRAAAAASASGRGRYGQRALDAIHRANDALLAEYGPEYARSRGADPWIGLTVDDPDHSPGWPALASRLTEPFGWVRIVFDPTVDRGDPRHYEAAVEAADRAGLRILGEPIDSFFANRYTRAEYLRRMQKFVDAYPQVDAWEVGNEVNGCWVNSRTDAEGNCTGRLLPENDKITNKISDSAAYVRERRPAAEVVVTLYWQIGTDYARWSVFNWSRANLPDRVRKDIDVVLLSQYVEDAPMGLAFDTVMRTLQAEFPDQLVGLGELGY